MIPPGVVSLFNWSVWQEEKINGLSIASRGKGFVLGMAQNALDRRAIAAGVFIGGAIHRIIPQHWSG